MPFASGTFCQVPSTEVWARWGTCHLNLSAGQMPVDREHQRKVKNQKYDSPTPNCVEETTTAQTEVIKLAQRPTLLVLGR